MAVKTVRAFTVCVLLMAGGVQASAETPTENVTVSATKLRKVFHEFLNTFVTPTPIGGKIARWERHVCPVVVGQTPGANAFIRQRVRYVAQVVGARIDPAPDCMPNIEIVFTTTPQALLDNVHKRAVVYLGYADSSAQLEKLATVTRPIQAWYTTETQDANGLRRIDSGWHPGVVMSFDGSTPLFDMPPTYAASSSRIRDGMDSGFNHILIVIDSSKMVGQKMVPLADYIAMLALTQLNSLDACQQHQPSIVNLMAAGCDHAEDGLTAFDLAYLQGLYNMKTSRGLVFQRNDITSVMADRLIDQPIAVAIAAH